MTTAKKAKININNGVDHIKKNINKLEDIASRNKTSRTRNHPTLSVQNSNKLTTKCKSQRPNSVVCKKFLLNPVKFYSNIPPTLEMKALDLKKDVVDNYQRNYDEYMNNNHSSKLEGNAFDYLSSFRNDTVLYDPLNYELEEAYFSDRPDKILFHKYIRYQNSNKKENKALDEDLNNNYFSS